MTVERARGALTKALDTLRHTRGATVADRALDSLANPECPLGAIARRGIVSLPSAPRGVTTADVLEAAQMVRAERPEVH